MRPDAVSEERVGAGHVERNGPDAASDPLDRRDDLLAETVEEERVADPDELCRHEAPLVVAAHKQRMLRRALHAATDDNEPVMRAEAHRADRLLGADDAVEALGWQPVVLRAVVDVDDKAGDLTGSLS